MRVFFGSQKIVEFAPNGAEDVPAAEQATDYINYVLTRDNPGFEIFLFRLQGRLGAEDGDYQVLLGFPG